MAFFIVKTSLESADELLRSWFNGESREEIQKQFVRKLSRGVYLTEAAGDILALLWALKNRHNGKVDIFLAEPLHEWDIPYKVKEVAKCLIEKPSAKERLRQVKEIKLKCSVSSNENSLESYDRENMVVE